MARFSSNPVTQTSLRACIHEGVLAQSMLVIVDYFMIPFLLFLDGTAVQVGLLVALPQLLVSVSQMWAVDTVKFAKSRLKLLTKGVLIQAGALVPAVVVAVAPLPYRTEIFIVSITAFRIAGAILGPAWGSLVSEYLPDNQRGRYFGYRSRILGLVGLANIAGWGLALYLMKKIDAAAGFAVLFGAAALFRAGSSYFMAKMEDRPLTFTKESDFTFWMFIRRHRESNFVKFVFYVSSITFATHIAAPFFSVFMLKELHFNYLTYSVVHLASVIAGLISFPIWGRHADLAGNARILKTTSVLIPFIPLLWLVSDHVAYLFLVEFLGGFVWGGFNLCAANFIFDAAVPEKRVRVLAYFNLINGVAIFAGALLGGFLVTRVPPVLGSSFYAIFLISGILRFVANASFSPRFAEVRSGAAPASSVDILYSVLGIRPMIGRNTEFTPVLPLTSQASEKRRQK